MKYFLLVILCSINPAFSSSKDVAEPASPTHYLPLNSERNIEAVPPQWLKPYAAHYRVYRGGDKKGKVTRELSLEQNLWTLSSYSKVSIFLFSDKRTEVTTFKWQANQLKTLSYIYQIKNTFSKKKTEEYFDWQLNIIQGHRDKKLNWQLPLEENVYNPLSYQIAIRQQLMRYKKLKDSKIERPEKLTLKVSSKGTIKDRVFLIEKNESIKTPAGVFETVKLLRKSGSRTTIFWLAEELDYIPIKIYQEKEGEEQATMMLAKLSFKDKNKQ